MFLYFQKIVFVSPHLCKSPPWLLQKSVCVQEKRDLDHKCHISVQCICVFYFRFLKQRRLDLVWGNKADLTCVYFGTRWVVLLGY